MTTPAEQRAAAERVARRIVEEYLPAEQWATRRVQMAHAIADALLTREREAGRPIVEMGRALEQALANARWHDDVEVLEAREDIINWVRARAKEEGDA